MTSGWKMWSEKDAGGGGVIPKREIGEDVPETEGR